MILSVSTQSFQNTDPRTLSEVLYTTAYFVSHLLGLNSTQRPKVSIRFSNEGHPFIYELKEYGEKVHIIKLAADNNNWEEFSFQLAHEWTHHILGEELPKSYDGLMWVEEVFCYLVAMEAVSSLSENFQWSAHFSTAEDFINNVSEYFSALVCCSKERVPQEWVLQQHDRQLSPDRWLAVALNLFSVFHTSPILFEILASAGHPIQFQTLQQYLCRIRSLASGRCNDSLSSIESYLLNYYNA